MRGLTVCQNGAALVVGCLTRNSGKRQQFSKKPVRIDRVLRGRWSFHAFNDPDQCHPVSLLVLHRICIVRNAP